MFNAAKGLPALLCSLVALTAAAQEGPWPDLTETEEPLIYSGSPGTQDLSLYPSITEMSLLRPGWEEQSRLNLLEDRLSAWLRRELQLRLPHPGTQELLAEIKNVNLLYLYTTDEAGNIARDACGHPLLLKDSGLWGETGDYSGWSTRITTAMATLMRDWEEEADLICQEILLALPADLAAAGEGHLFASLADYKQSVEREFERLYRQEESLFLHARLRDAASLREQSEAGTAAALTRTIISDTEPALAGIKTALDGNLSLLDDPLQAPPGGTASAVENWQEYFQQELKSACKVWNQAESRLIEERIRWERDAESGFLAGKEAWDAAYAEFRQARSGWLEEFSLLAAEGAKRWLEQEGVLVADCRNTAAELLKAAERETDRVRTEIEGLLGDYRRSRDLVALADSSIASLEEQISHSGDAAQRSLCEEEAEYWREIRSRYSERQETVLQSLSALEAEILGESGPEFDDPYALELERLRGQVEFLQRQGEIAAAVVDYAECRTSERPTRAQTAASYEQAGQLFADAEQAYLAALERLEQYDRDLIESEEALAVLEAETAVARQAFADAEEAYRLANSLILADNEALFTSRIAADTAILRDYYESGRQALYEDYFYLQEKLLRHELQQEAADLLSRFREGDSEIPGVAELKDALVRVSELELDWSLSAEEFMLRLQLAGLGPETPYADELQAAYSEGLRDDAFPDNAELAVLRAGFYLEKIKEEARRKLHESLTAIALLQTEDPGDPGTAMEELSAAAADAEWEYQMQKALLEKQALEALLSPGPGYDANAVRLSRIYRFFGNTAPVELESRIRELEELHLRLSALQRGETAVRDRVLVDFLQGRDAFSSNGFNYVDCFLLEEAEHCSRTRTLRNVTGALVRLSPVCFSFFRAGESDALRDLLGACESAGDPGTFSRLAGITSLAGLQDLFAELYSLHPPGYLLEILRGSLSLRITGSLPDLKPQIAAAGGSLAELQAVEDLLASGGAGTPEQAGLAYRYALAGSERYLTAVLAAAVSDAQSRGIDFGTAFTGALAQCGVGDFSPVPVLEYIQELNRAPGGSLPAEAYVPLLDGELSAFIRQRFPDADLYRQAFLAEQFLDPNATLGELQERIDRRYIASVLESLRREQDELGKQLFVLTQIQGIAGLPRTVEARIGSDALTYNEAEAYTLYLSLALREYTAPGRDPAVTKEAAAAAAERLRSSAAEMAERRNRISEYEQALSEWREDKAAYMAETVQPLAARLEECRVRYEQARSASESRLTVLEALVRAYGADRQTADRAYDAYREAGYRLQEAEEISSYAHSGNVSDGIDPREILAARLAEHRRTQRVLDLVTGLYAMGEEERTFAERNPRYAALEAEQTHWLGTQILLIHARDQLAAQVQRLEQENAQALAELGTGVGGLVDLGDLPFSADALTLGLGLEDFTDFSRPEALTEEALADYFGDSGGAFLRDTMIWLGELARLITPEDLKGDGLIYHEIGNPLDNRGFFYLLLPVALSDTGLMGVLKDFAFACFYETGEVEVAAESQQAYGLLCDEIDVDPDVHLQKLGQRTLKTLRADPGLYKLYSFFKLLWSEERLLADTAFMSRDLSFEAVKFLKKEANNAIEDIKKRYPIIHVVMPGRKKRIREYRDSLQYIHGGEGKKLLIEEILDLADRTETYRAGESELAQLLGRPGMPCSELIAALSLVLGREIEAGTAGDIQTLFSATPVTGQSTAAILERLISQAGAEGAALQSEIDGYLARLRSDRAEDTAAYRRLLGERNISWQELADAARRLFYNPEFTEEDLLRSKHEQAESLRRISPSSELPALQLRCGALLDLYAHKLAAAGQARINEHTLQLESLRRRRLEWQESIQRLYAAGLREWDAGRAALDRKREEWLEAFRAQYDEKVRLWDRKYVLFGLARQNWLEESTALGYASAGAVIAREMRIKADSLTAGVENIIVPDMTACTPRLSTLVHSLTGREGLGALLERTRDISRGIGALPLLRQPYLPFTCSYRRNSLAFEDYRSALEGEIYKKAALVNALRMREIVTRTRQEVREVIADANESAGRQICNTLEAAGYRRTGHDFQRSALIDRTLLGGTEKERQYIRGYSAYQAPDLDVGLNLDRTFLEGLNGELIQSAVKKAVDRLQEYLALIFGQKELEEAGDIDTAFRSFLETERERFRSSAQYADYSELNGLFAMHVGYAPVMKEDDPENVALAGYGEYGRIFALFLRNEARLSRGLAMLSIPVYDLRLWDDDRDNDGEPDGWLHAPTPRGLIDLSVSIIGTVLLGPGTGMLALSLVDDAVFTGLDLAGGRTDWAEVGVDLGKKGLIGLVSQGFASFNASAVAQMGGSIEGVIARTIYTGGSRFVENLATGIVGAVEVHGSGLTLNADVLEDSVVGSGALIDVAAGMSDTLVRESLNAVNLSYENTAGFSRLHVADAAVFNSTVGSLAGAAVELGLGGHTGVNILNLRDFSGKGPGHGLLELHLGGQAAFLNVGSAGYDLSASRIARTVSGFQVHRTNSRIKGFSRDFQENTGYATDIMLRAEYSFSDQLGRDTLENILAGRDLLHIGLAGAEGMTLFRRDGGRDIYLQPAGPGLDNQLYAAVLLQHEAHRDGIVTADNALETREAVTARVLMAERILPDYGEAFILGNEALAKDFIAYEMSRRLGRDFWNDYIDNSYSSREDFARRILNWERRGRVGVIPTADAFGIADTLFGGFASLGRMLHLSKGERLDITESPPGELEDLLAGSLSLITLATSFSASGLTESLSAANLVDFTFYAFSPLPNLPNGTLSGLLNFSAGVSQQLLQAREVMRYVLRDDLDECQKWHGEIDRDKTIFSMAKEIGIDLSIPYEETRSEDYYRIVEQQMVMRYIWLGNRIFNDGITDPEDLRMLFYGPYVEVFDEEHGLRQYQRLPGYIDKECSEFFGMGDHSEYDDKFFLDYVDNFIKANTLLQKSYLSVPVNWSFAHQEDVYTNWQMNSEKVTYYYSFTSYWELRYKNLMLSLEE